MRTDESYVIETQRLLLRPFCRDDLDIVYRLYSDWEIIRYTPFDRMDRTSAQTHLDRIILSWEDNPLISREMAVVRKDSGEKIGRVHIHMDLSSDSAMIGWLLIRKEWGKGYATEMTETLLDHCFHTLGVHRVYALCHPENGASRHVLERCGLRLEAWFKEKCGYPRNGTIEWNDELVYAMLRHERGDYA